MLMIILDMKMEYTNHINTDLDDVIILSIVRIVVENYIHFGKCPDTTMNTAILASY